MAAVGGMSDGAVAATWRPLTRPSSRPPAPLSVHSSACPPVILPIGFPGLAFCLAFFIASPAVALPGIWLFFLTSFSYLPRSAPCFAYLHASLVSKLFLLCASAAHTQNSNSSSLSTQNCLHFLLLNILATLVHLHKNSSSTFFAFIVVLSPSCLPPPPSLGLISKKPGMVMTVFRGDDAAPTCQDKLWGGKLTDADASHSRRKGKEGALFILCHFMFSVKTRMPLCEEIRHLYSFVSF